MNDEWGVAQTEDLKNPVMLDVAKSKEQLKALKDLEKKKKELASLKAEWAYRQQYNAIKYIKPHPKQNEFFRSRAGIRIISGGNRCLGGETEVYDPVICRTNRIDEITSDFHVWAWNGHERVIAEASQPFMKDVDDLYRIGLSNGESFVASMSHLVLSSCGWASVYKLKLGSLLFQPQTISDISQSTHASSEDHSQRTTQDYQSGCRHSPHSYDEQPLCDQEVGPSVFPSQDDVQERNAQPVFPFYVYGDGQGNREEHIHSDLLSSHLSSQDALSRNEARPVDFGYAHASQSLKSASRLYSTVDLPTHAYFHQSQSIYESGQQASSSYSTAISSVTSSAVVTSIDYIRTDVKWDLTVPEYGNYILAGVIHHNSGKSQAGIQEDVAHALGYRPWLSETDPDYKVNVRVPNKGLIIGETFGEQVKKVLVPKLLGDAEGGFPGFLPSHEFESAKKNQQGIITHIQLKNNSTIDLQSYDQPVELFESADYDWVHFDEPPPRPIWIAVKRGLTDRMGRAWFTMTPLSEAWIFDELMSREDVFKIYFDIWDNRGYGLTEESIKEFEKHLTEDEKEARIHGRFFHLSGLIYKLYGPVNRIKRIPIDRHWGMWFHVDTHPRTPHHAVWMAVLPDGKLFVCGELKNFDSSNRVAPFAEAIKEYEMTVLKRRGDEIVRLIEPGSSTPNPTKDGLSIKDEFEEHGIYCRPGSKNRDAGILRLQNALQFDPTLGTYPNIYFFNDLSGIDYEMTHYVWDDWAQKAAWGRTDKQKPKDRDDHFIEGIHRILLDEPECVGLSQDEYEPVSSRTTSNSITGY